jgi:hypothetical protein
MDIHNIHYPFGALAPTPIVKPSRHHVQPIPLHNVVIRQRRLRQQAPKLTRYILYM